MLPHDRDFAPARRGAVAGVLGAYTASRLRQGRSLFDILGDEFVEERRDDQLDLLGALAADALVRDELGC